MTPAALHSGWIEAIIQATDCSNLRGGFRFSTSDGPLFRPGLRPRRNIDALSGSVFTKFADRTVTFWGLVEPCLPRGIGGGTRNVGFVVEC